MKIETLQELGDRMDGLIESIDNEDLEEKETREFVEHKYLLLSLHAHMEGNSLKKYMDSKEKKVKYQKQLDVYQKIEKTLGRMLNSYSTETLYNHLKRCQEIIHDSLKHQNT